MVQGGPDPGERGEQENGEPLHDGRAPHGFAEDRCSGIGTQLYTKKA